MNRSWKLLVLATSTLSLVACGAARSSDDDAAGSSLIGGRPATATEYPATLIIARNCTAAKIGPRHILTAGHCVMYPGQARDPRFLPGATLQISTSHDIDATNENDARYISVVVESAHVHPSWEREQATGLNLGPNPAADVAIITLAQASEAAIAAIPSAHLDTQAVQPGDPLVVMGYGCETGVQQAESFDYTHSRLKLQQTTALAPTEALQPGREPAPAPNANVPGNYFFTPGRDPSNQASLCPGDSGGPVYRADGTERTIVGVNAYYNFDPGDAIGVSLTNWHTRLDAQALDGVGAWAADVLAGNAVDGGVVGQGGACPGTAPTKAELDGIGWRAPQPQPNACSAADLTTLASNLSTATDLGSVVANLPAACSQCLLSHEADPTWQLLVVDANGQNGFVNWGACYAAAPGGSGACGKAVELDLLCAQATCSQCATSDTYTACESSPVTAQGCSPFASDVQFSCPSASSASLEAACGKLTDAAATLCGPHP